MATHVYDHRVKPTRISTDVAHFTLLFAPLATDTTAEEVALAIRRIGPLAVLQFFADVFGC